jgi:transcription antitermination factor NusG
MKLEKNRKRWLVCYTAPRAEKKVNERLKNWEIEAYLPTQRVLKQWSDRKKWVEEALFRSYIFVRVTPVEQQQVVQVPGILRFIYYLGRPAEISEKQIEDIRALLRNEVPLEAMPLNLKKGDLIRITAGPLKDIEGQLLKIQGKRKLVIRLKGIEQSVVASISPHQIEKITTLGDSSQG